MCKSGQCQILLFCSGNAKWYYFVVAMPNGIMLYWQCQILLFCSGNAKLYYFVVAMPNGIML
jgi:hypothetical protein